MKNHAHYFLAIATTDDWEDETNYDENWIVSGSDIFREFDEPEYPIKRLSHKNNVIYPEIHTGLIA
jgi:hypothetical protein